MAQINGKNVAIDGISNGGRVEIQRVVKAGPIYHSAGLGGADRAAGNIDFVGRFSAWGHTPTVFPNDAFTLAFTLDGGGTTSGLTAANVVCTGLDIVVPVFDPSARNGVYYVVYFGAGGTDLSASGATTGVAVPILSTKGLACTLAGTLQTNVQGMKLSFRSNGEPYVDSGSASGVYSRPAGNIDWTLQCRKTIATMASCPVLNVVGATSMQVASGITWAMSYGRITGVEGVFDPQSGEVLAADITTEMCFSEAAVLGTIADPAGATKWPV